jgi:hypothetical protein
VRQYEAQGAIRVREYDDIRGDCVLKVQRIDDVTRSQHSFLDEDDDCLSLREYTSGPATRTATPTA